MMVPKEDDQMLSTVVVRMFPEMKTKIEQNMEREKDRWSNESHFVRSAVAHFLNHLDKKEV